MKQETWIILSESGEGEKKILLKNPPKGEKESIIIQYLTVM